MLKTTLRSFDTPTDLFIFGVDFEDRPETLSLTDDYCSMGVMFKGEEGYLDTVGYVFLYTPEELNENWEALRDEDKENLEYSSFLLKDYVGDVLLTTTEGFDLSKVNLKDYLQYQFESDDWIDFLLEVDYKKSNVKRMSEEDILNYLEEA